MDKNVKANKGKTETELKEELWRQNNQADDNLFVAKDAYFLGFNA